jgi:hypothetical protein
MLGEVQVGQINPSLPLNRQLVNRSFQATTFGPSQSRSALRERFRPLVCLTDSWENPEISP